MCCEVVQESLLPGGRHWHLPNLILDWLWITIPESILSGQCRSKCHQHFGGVFILSRKPDSRRLLRQFPNLSLRPQIHRPLDLGGQILLQAQIECPKSDYHHVLQTTCRLWSGGLVCSSPEDRPDAVGKWSVPIYAPVNNCDPCTLCSCSTNPFFCTLLSSSSSAFHSAKTPSTSTCTIWWNAHGHKHSSENMLFTSVRLLSVRRGQPSCKGLPLLFGHPEVNCRAKGGIDWRFNGPEGCSRGRRGLFNPGEGFCLALLCR